MKDQRMRKRSPPLIPFDFVIKDASIGLPHTSTKAYTLAQVHVQFMWRCITPSVRLETVPACMYVCLQVRLTLPRCPCDCISARPPVARGRPIYNRLCILSMSSIAPCLNIYLSVCPFVPLSLFVCPSLSLSPCHSHNPRVCLQITNIPLYAQYNPYKSFVRVLSDHTSCPSDSAVLCLSECNPFTIYSVCFNLQISIKSYFLIIDYIRLGLGFQPHSLLVTP